MSGTVFVITGRTGEYSDRRNWIVGYVDNEVDAAVFVKRAQAEADRILDELDVIDTDRPFNYMDPNFEIDYTGTGYSYEEVKKLEVEPGLDPATFEVVSYKRR